MAVKPTLVSIGRVEGGKGWVRGDIVFHFGIIIDYNRCFELKTPMAYRRLYKPSVWTTTETSVVLTKKLANLFVDPQILILLHPSTHCKKKQKKKKKRKEKAETFRLGWEQHKFIAGLIYLSSPYQFCRFTATFPLVFGAATHDSAIVQVWVSAVCSHWMWDHLSYVIQAGCTTRQHTVTVICTDLPPLLVLLLQIAIDYNAVVLLTVTMNTSLISFLK